MLNLRYIISIPIIMIWCNTCKSRFLSHSRLIACNVCENINHLKCISLKQTEQEEILKDASRSWMCRECHKSLFPFNWKDDEEFMVVVNANEYNLNSLNGNDENVHKIFDHVEDDDALPMYDLDPDLNLYNDNVPNLNLNCKYLAEESFNSTYDQMFHKNGGNPVSLCHININRVPRKILRISNVFSLDYNMNSHSLVSQKPGLRVLMVIFII